MYVWLRAAAAAAEAAARLARNACECLGNASPSANIKSKKVRNKTGGWVVGRQ